jgi:hypothetical protein
MTTEFQVAETVEELERELTSLTAQIREHVDKAQDPEACAALVRQKQDLTLRLGIARGERVRAEQEARARERQEAEREFPKALEQCKAERESFLAHRRAACIALGNYLKAMERACGLSNKLAHETLGPFPQYLNAVLALELGDAPEQSLSDLQPDMGAGWKTTFAVTPRYETHNSRR